MAENTLALYPTIPSLYSGSDQLTYIDVFVLVLFTFPTYGELASNVFTISLFV
jgi:hypothetical protein